MLGTWGCYRRNLRPQVSGKGNSCISASQPRRPLLSSARRIHGNQSAQKFPTWGPFRASGSALENEVVGEWGFLSFARASDLQSGKALQSNTQNSHRSSRNVDEVETNTIDAPSIILIISLAEYLRQWDHIDGKGSLSAQTSLQRPRVFSPSCIAVLFGLGYTGNSANPSCSCEATPKPMRKWAQSCHWTHYWFECCVAILLQRGGLLSSCTQIFVQDLTFRSLAAQLRWLRSPQNPFSRCKAAA